MLTGELFDWDLAGPTTPLMELAFIAWNCVPLWRDIGDDASAERIRRISSAYGGVHPAQIADVVPRRIQMMLDWIPRGAGRCDTTGVVIDWAHRLTEQLDRHGRLRPRCDGLTDAEYFWEPAASTWSIRPRGHGRAAIACRPRILLGAATR